VEEGKAWEREAPTRSTKGLSGGARCGCKIEINGTSAQGIGPAELRLPQTRDHNVPVALYEQRPLQGRNSVAQERRTVSDFNRTLVGEDVFWSKETLEEGEVAVSRKGLNVVKYSGKGKVGTSQSYEG